MPYRLSRALILVLVALMPVGSAFPFEASTVTLGPLLPITAGIASTAATTAGLYCGFMGNDGFWRNIEECLDRGTVENSKADAAAFIGGEPASPLLEETFGKIRADAAAKGLGEPSEMAMASFILDAKPKSE